MRGTRGGEDWICELFNWKEVIGRSSSSSSERRGDLGSSGMVDVSETKDRLGAWVLPNLACRRWYTGDDSGNRCILFQDVEDEVEVLTLARAWLLDPGYLLKDELYRVLLLWLWLLPERLPRLPDRWTSSENIGAASGEESRTPF